jgi:hypothetical protein
MRLEDMILVSVDDHVVEPRLARRGPAGEPRRRRVARWGILPGDAPHHCAAGAVAARDR